MHTQKHKRKPTDTFYFFVHVLGLHRIKRKADVIRARLQCGPRRTAPPSRVISARESRRGWKPVTLAKVFRLQEQWAWSPAWEWPRPPHIAYPVCCCRTASLHARVRASTCDSVASRNDPARYSCVRLGSVHPQAVRRLRDLSLELWFSGY